MKPLTLEDLVLLREGEAVQKHFDLKNFAVLKKLLVAFALWGVGAAIAGVVERDPLLLGVACAGLLAALVLLAVRETEPFARHFRHILLLYLLLQLFLLILPANPATAMGLAGFVFPLGLLLFRLRTSEYLLLAGTFWAVSAVLRYRQVQGTVDPIFDDTFVGATVVTVLVLAVVVGLALRQRRAFLAEWRREHAKQRERQRLRQEIDYARRIQLAMLPQVPPQAGWLDLSAVSLPATEVGGDYYDYFQLSPTRLAVVVGDVAGHGLASGLLLSGVRSCLYLLAEDLADPVAVLQRLHRMVRRTTDRRTFVTLLVAILDAEARTLTVAAAGHPPVLRWSGHQLEEVGRGAPPLGTGLEPAYQEHVRPLLPGDFLILYTDGLIESSGGLGREYGEARLRRVLERAGDRRSAREVRDAILEDLSNFKADSEQLDDITLVVARVR